MKCVRDIRDMKTIDMKLGMPPILKAGKLRDRKSLLFSIFIYGKFCESNERADYTFIRTLFI
jgi:hypothetical protein